jgi:vacuolar-type H+-ATPase subunit E/Vma4
MGTNELVEKILADGRKRAAGISAERDRTVGETRARAASEVAGVEADNAERSRRECNAILERARSSARLAQRSAVLTARWKVLDLVVQRAQEKFLADKGYPDMLMRLVEKHARPDSVVRLSAADSRSFGARLGKKLGEPAPLAGGVLVRTGKEELNFSLAEALSALRDELSRDLSQILFQG